MSAFRSFSKLFRGRGRPAQVVHKPARARLGLESLDDRIVPSVTSTFSAATGVLTVAGDDLDNTIVVSRDAAGTILVNNGAVVIQGGPATVTNTSKIVVTGGAGNDVLTADETNGGLPQTSLDGGAGNDLLTGGAVADVPGLISGFDTLLGGAGDDTIFGGAGADFINGGTGNDTLFGGAGNDRFSWSPGDGNDTMDGQDGTDSLGFFGSDGNENIALSANGTRVRLTRDVDGVTADLNSLEVVDVLARGGADNITVNDLTGTGVGVLLLDLGDTGTGGDGQADTVTVNGTNGNDNVSITGSTIGGASLDVVGLSAQISIFSTEPTDTLKVNTLGGFDRVDSSGLDAGVIGLSVDLGDGQAAGVATATALSTSTATAVLGQSVTLTASVSTAAGVPTGGFVTFRAGDSVLGTAPVDANGQATFTTSLNVGTASLTASYTGTGDFANSTSSAVALTVNRASTAVAVTPSVNQATTGQSVTLTATVSVLAPGTGLPSGTVTFMDGNVVLGTATVSPLSGTARITTSFAAAGGHVITAVYSGDANFAGSSQSLTEQVNAPAAPQATTTALASSLNPAVAGQSVTFTATVLGPAGAVPTGTVTFMDGSTVLGTATVGTDGTARITTSFAAAGGHVITAVYSGDANFAGSSQSLTEQVNAPAAPQVTATVLASSHNLAVVGQSVTFTATVRGPAGSAPPTGTVTFLVNGQVVARVTLDANGQARLSGSFASRGLFNVQAVYSGDANFAASSWSLTERVR
jgi:hypothetical protein